MLLGVNQLNRNIQRALKVVSRDEKEALKEVGERGVGIFKGNTTVVSGRLRNSWGYTTNSKVVATQARREDTVRTNREKDSVVIGTNVVYAPSVEYKSKTGSAGFALRSYRQLVPIAKEIFKRVMGGVTD